jgi:RNase P/RNase MRP subunit POP5
MIFRRKLRYVLVEASREVNLADKRMVDDLKAKLRGAMGEAQYFRANLHVVAQLREDVFIISTNRGQERDLVLALSFVKTLGGEKVGFYTIKISGTIRSLKDYFFKSYAQ